MMCHLMYLFIKRPWEIGIQLRTLESLERLRFPQDLRAGKCYRNRLKISLALYHLGCCFSFYNRDPKLPNTSMWQKFISLLSKGSRVQYGSPHESFQEPWVLQFCCSAIPTRSIVVAPAPAIATAFQSMKSRTRGREGHAFLFQDTICCLHCIQCFCSSYNSQNGHMASPSCWEMSLLFCEAKDPPKHTSGDLFLK